MNRLDRPQRRLSLERPTVRGNLTVVLLAAAIGLVAGYAGRAATEDDAKVGGLLVNGGELQSLVFESLGGAGGQPPACNPTTDDGIGLWRCTIFIDRSTPQEFAVTVSKRGAVSGRAVNGEQRISGCCLEILRQ